jgi:hypothetical protein
MHYVRSRKRKGSSSELDVARSIELLILEASLLGVYTGQLVIILWASFRAPFQKLKVRIRILRSAPRNITVPS